jgi:type I restriction enzyme S subunit
MAVKPGYKQTAVGVIPEEWDIKTLGSLTSLLTNGFVGTATSAYVNGEDGVLYIQGYNVQENGFNFRGIKRVSKSFHARNQKSCLQSGDLLTIQTGDIGVTTVVPPELVGANCHALVISRLNKRVSDPSFYCQYFNSEQGRAAFKEIETGTTMKHLNCGDMKRLFLPSPPVEEQRSIATALSDVDALMGALERFIAKKRDLKQATMQQLLTGQTRLPGFQGEWEVKNLKAIVQTPVTDGPHLTPRFWDNGIPFLSVNNLVGNRIDLTDLRFISEADHELFSRKCKPQKDDILLGKAASVGKVAIVELDDEFNIWSPIALIRIGSEHAARFVYYQLQSADLIGQIALLTNSSSQGNIGMGDIEKLMLKLPPLTEQTAIAAVLTDMDAELAALEQRLDKTRTLKQGMMQELLTGRTRLV